MFNIVAGTSIGAINGAVLVSYVVENQIYEGSAERLVDFWNYLSKDSMVDTNPFFKPWWDYWHAMNKEIASGEAQEKPQEGTFQPKSLQYLEYPLSFILMDETVNFMIRTIPGIAIVTNH
jgi:predicted acylesterase/phospholipase RssA